MKNDPDRRNAHLPFLLLACSKIESTYSGNAVHRTYATRRAVKFRNRLSSLTIFGITTTFNFWTHYLDANFDNSTNKKLKRKLCARKLYAWVLFSILLHVQLAFFRNFIYSFIHDLKAPQWQTSDWSCTVHSRVYWTIGHLASSEWRRFHIQPHGYQLCTQRWWFPTVDFVAHDATIKITLEIIFELPCT